MLPIRLESGASLFIVLQVPAASSPRTRKKNWPLLKKTQTLEGPWTVRFDSTFGGPSEPVDFRLLQDWSLHSDSSIRYYSGTARYTKTFRMGTPEKGKAIYLQLGKVANLAEVFVNGISCGVAWTAPYRVEITKALRPGTNSLRIDVTNTWANRMIGDHRLAEEKRITKTISPYRLEGKPLLEAGLIGPVEVVEQ